jgi:hypothetical protein
MTTLSADRQVIRVPHDSDIIERMICEATVYAGSLVKKGASAKGITAFSTSDTSGFAGICLKGGITGEVVEVLRKGRIRTTVNITLAQSDADLTIYAKCSSTKSDNPADMTTTSTNNCKVGKISLVHTTGAQDTGLADVYLEADAFQSV